MKTVKKVSHSQSLFPFSFVYRSSKDPQSELPYHIHDFYEIIYVHRGKGVFFINHNLYEMSKGDVFIIPNDTLHYAKPDKNDLVTSSAIFFSPVLIHNISVDESFSYLTLLESIKKKRDYKISLPVENSIQVEQYLKNIQNELGGQKTGSVHASILVLHQILLDLSRFRIQEDPKRITGENLGPTWINEVFPYLEMNLYKSISLTELAKQALVSPEHFSRVFKQITGMGLTSYINQRRITRAKELLVTTRESVAKIAEKCGFESTPHFYRIFKNYIGKTPADYRRSQQTN
jgi:AraC-like DNA-binding protein